MEAATNYKLQFKFVVGSCIPLKYQLKLIIIGTIIKDNDSFLRVKTELGKIVEIAKDKVFSVKDQ